MPPLSLDDSYSFLIIYQQGREEYHSTQLLSSHRLLKTINK
jgi:hypothetical protein